MKKERKYWIIAGAALIILILTTMANWKTILTTFIPQWEGFEPKPYWDVKQWSWGYGTKVPGSGGPGSPNPGGSITKSQALQEAIKHLNNDYLYLRGLVRIPLKNNQWAALLSFSYNEGSGNADNLVANINAGPNYSALETQWKKYIYADGEISQDLIDRRDAEWNLFVA